MKGSIELEVTTHRLRITLPGCMLHLLAPWTRGGESLRDRSPCLCDPDPASFLAEFTQNHGRSPQQSETMGICDGPDWVLFMS